MNDVLAGQRYFQDIAVGDEFEQTQQPTREHVLAFIAAAKMHDGNGRFVDPVRARAAGLPNAIVPGPMSAAMLTRLVTDWMGPLGRVLSLDLSFRRPVQHDDRLRCVALVTDVDGDGDLAGTGAGIVHLDVTLENERSEKPVQGTAIVELPLRPQES